MLYEKKNPDAVGAATGADIQKASNFNLSPADLFLSRLDRVTSQGDGRWKACCPAHNDHSPSMSIRENPDGSVLVHCFCGCGFQEIVDAVGLQASDLFPPRPESRGSIRASQRWVPRDVLETVANEALVAMIAANTVARGESLGEKDVERTALAASRLRAAAREVGYDC